MRRLLEWKQRMLQSPLTRKSSRNASRTQTPTNSNSPVPSLLFQQQQQHQQHHGENNFRQRVLEELERQVIRSRFPFHWFFFANPPHPQDVRTQSTPSEQRRSSHPSSAVMRKGSGASRSSRSRSSPRIAANRLPNTTSSSDEGESAKKSNF